MFSEGSDCPGLYCACRGGEEGLKAFLHLSLAHTPSRAVTALQEMGGNRAEIDAVRKH